MIFFDAVAENYFSMEQWNDYNVYVVLNFCIFELYFDVYFYIHLSWFY